MHITPGKDAGKPKLASAEESFGVLGKDFTTVGFTQSDGAATGTAFLPSGARAEVLMGDQAISGTHRPSEHAPKRPRLSIHPRSRPKDS